MTTERKNVDTKTKYMLTAAERAGEKMLKFFSNFERVDVREQRMTREKIELAHFWRSVLGFYPRLFVCLLEKMFQLLFWYSI